MTQEDKELLIKDLCARFPYGVKCKSKYFNGDILQGIIIDDDNTLFNFSINDSGFITQLYISEFKPYLFPLSSMTEKQKKEAPFETSLLNSFLNGYIYLFEKGELTINDVNRMYNWLLKNHFDIFGLIPKGLAIDATNLNIY